jgi:hypothetical protein
VTFVNRRTAPTPIAGRDGLRPFHQLVARSHRAGPPGRIDRLRRSIRSASAPHPGRKAPREL